MQLKQLENATGADTSNLAAKKLKAEVDKLYINELVTVPTGLEDLKTKVDDLDVGKFKTAPRDLK